MDKKAIIATLILWVLIALFKCTQTKTDLAPNEGCEVLLHSGVSQEWEEGGVEAPYSRRACWWETASELKTLLEKGSREVVVIGHGSMTFSGDSHVGGVAYATLKEWKRGDQVVAVFACRTAIWRSLLFWGDKVVYPTPFWEDGLIVWVKAGQTLAHNVRLAYGQAFVERLQEETKWGF